MLICRALLKYGYSSFSGSFPPIFGGKEYFNKNQLIKHNYMAICRSLLKHGYSNFSVKCGVRDEFGRDHSNSES
jgi:hypothetical protein